MLFRIEDISGLDPNLRKYNVNEFVCPIINKVQIDNYIAQKIREEVNGSKNRELLSYSRSLATCILKYNKYTDNELHICFTNGLDDYITYISPEGEVFKIDYSIEDRINGNSLFDTNGEIRLQNFIIDVSNNILLDQYLRCYTGIGKTIFASPEKDSEVVVMNPPNDFVINQYMDALYILYGLQLKYGFLSNPYVRTALISELNNMHECRFENCPQERAAFVNLILYLSINWQYEKQISSQIYISSKKDEHISFGYDSILQFDGIMNNSFFEAYYDCDNQDVMSMLFWKYCSMYLGQKPYLF